VRPPGTPLLVETPEDQDDQVWLAGLLDRLGPEAAYDIADALGIDLDDEDG
jgi:hypothetical protein